MHSMNKHYLEIVDACREQGWTVERTTQGHWKAMAPDKSQEIVHFSMSEDYHAYHNTIRDLKQRGLVWPPPRRARASDGANSPDAQIARIQAELDAKNGTPSSRDEINPTPETREEQMDRLYAELKECRTMVEIAGEHYQACEKTLREAQQQFEKSVEERRLAVNALAAKREEFNKVFEAA